MKKKVHSGIKEFLKVALFIVACLCFKWASELVKAGFYRIELYKALGAVAFLIAVVWTAALTLYGHMRDKEDQKRFMYFEMHFSYDTMVGRYVAEKGLDRYQRNTLAEDALRKYIAQKLDEERERE